jgi:hypothetical protein
MGGGGGGGGEAGMTKTPTCVYLSLHLSIHGIFAMIVGTQPPLSNFFQVVQTKSTAARFYNLI